MFVTSDEEDREEDGAIDYKYGLAHNHRLLGAITEVCKYGLRYTRDPFSELECIYIQIYAAIFPTHCLLYTSPSPRDLSTSRMPSSA